MAEPNDPELHPEAVAAACATLDRFLVALNALDPAGIAETLHFPHYRLSLGRMVVWQGIEDYLASFRSRAGEEWHRTVCDFRRPISAAANKVHLDVQWTRYRADGSELTRLRAIWTMAKLEGRWAAQLRSSFGV